MVFLDQEGVGQPQPMVAAPAQYGVFQRGAQAGQGLAGIEQASPGAFQQGHVAVDLGRHAGERLHEVQRGALAGQHHPRGAAQPAKRLVRRQTVAVSHQPLHQHLVAQLNKDLIQPAAATEYAGFAGDDGGFGLLVRR